MIILASVDIQQSSVSDLYCKDSINMVWDFVLKIERVFRVGVLTLTHNITPKRA